MSDVSALVSEIKAVNAVYLLIKKQLEDGFQAGSDISAILSAMMEEPLKSQLQAAFKSASDVVAEAKGLDVAGGIEIAGAVAQAVIEDVSAAKAAAAAPAADVQK